MRTGGQPLLLRQLGEVTPAQKSGRKVITGFMADKIDLPEFCYVGQSRNAKKCGDRIENS